MVNSSLVDHKAFNPKSTMPPGLGLLKAEQNYDPRFPKVVDTTVACEIKESKQENTI